MANFALVMSLTVFRFGIKVKYLPEVSHLQRNEGNVLIHEGKAELADSLLVIFEYPGIKSINVQVANILTSASKELEIEILAVVEGLRLEVSESPTANKTINITLTVQKVVSSMY